MSKRLKLLDPLRGEQLAASCPRDHAALSASAGTGKTHVLSARVLRLLLSGVDPASILCLTFTKAGAAEMADRIHARLAKWVRMKDADLGSELKALGEEPTPEARDNARTLFARVLDAAGGGLRIQTIHAFAQGLLAAFPAEADLTPGFRPLEGREEQLLGRQTLAELLVTAERTGDLGFLRDVQALSHRLGEGGAEAYLMRCARAPVAMAALGARDGIEARLRRAFDLPAGDIDEHLAAACCDDMFDLAGLQAIVAANRAWGTKTGLECCDIIADWLARDHPARATSLAELASVVLTGKNEPRVVGKGLLKIAPDYGDHAARLGECCQRLLGMVKTAALIECLAAGLRAGQHYAAAYAAAKRARGLVDFDDLIRWTEKLLTTPGMGDWVRYKLDQATDHILVDEAQDTNARQWRIVAALTEEFFAGEGAVGRHRTIFTVGDFKQAIFGFQGTDPREFELARSHFESLARDARQSALDSGVLEEEIPPDFLNLSMDRSFRSSPEILALVDRTISELGHEALGLPRPPPPHASHHVGRPGSVTLWQPHSDELEEAADEAGDEGWVRDTTRLYAGKLARQIRHWLDHPFVIAGKGRPLRPEDILILVRKRGDLASLIVARLHGEGVPVAGVDRLRLAAPLAVQDLLAAMRFAAQPLDDLNLASLLVSPLLGWSQDDLFALAHQRPGALWHALRDHADAAGKIGDARAALLSMLAMADFATPHEFLETLLSGPLDGRRKLIARLGVEARDPIAEIVASALEFEANGALSLQRFLDWFARGEVEIVRDPSAPLDAVRVMTVHGSKGLQSPVVILADACGDPSRSRGERACFQLEPDGPSIPIIRPRKDELAEPLRGQIEAQDKLERAEHWRLLYVALTRAEERLYIGGALGAADRNGPPAESWYAGVERALTGLGAEWRPDFVWGKHRRLGAAEIATKSAAAAGERAVVLPDWIARPAPIEARPPRPLAPSAPGPDETAFPPPSPAMRAAAERGRLLHLLFERLPAVPPEARADRADAWLASSAGVTDADLRAALIGDALGIIDDPAYARLFGPEALAEAPIAAVTADGSVVAGTVDRLLVGNTAIEIVDFKTGRALPADAGAVPLSHLRQMAAYVAALEAIFPGRAVSASLLYTAGPVLIPLPPALLAPHRPT